MVGQPPAVAAEGDRPRGPPKLELIRRIEDSLDQSKIRRITSKSVNVENHLAVPLSDRVGGARLFSIPCQRRPTRPCGCAWMIVRRPHCWPNAPTAITPPAIPATEAFVCSVSPPLTAPPQLAGHLLAFRCRLPLSLTPHVRKAATTPPGAHP